MKFDLPLINTHTHAAMIGLRGLGEDQPLDSWLKDYIWPAEKNIDSRFVYQKTKQAIAEMKKNKIAAFCDMYFFEDQVARAALEMEMPVVLGIGMTDIDNVPFERKLEKSEELILKFKNHPRVKVSVAPHSIYSVGRKNLIKAKQLARKHNVLFQMHLAETKGELDNCMKKFKKTPTQYVGDLGLLDENTLLAHCVWVNDEDLEIIAASGASVAHCPLSNLKLGSGIAPVSKMLKKGINVSLGTDGAASSNRLDVWEAAKFALLLQRGITQNSSVINSLDLVKMMTLNGIKALHIDDMAGLNLSEVNKKIEKYNNFDFLYHTNIEELE